MDTATAKSRSRPKRPRSPAPQLRKWKADELQSLIRDTFPEVGLPVPAFIREPNSTGRCEALLLSILQDPDKEDAANKLYRDYLSPYACFRDVYTARAERERSAAAEDQRLALLAQTDGGAQQMAVDTAAPLPPAQAIDAQVEPPLQQSALAFLSAAGAPQPPTGAVPLPFFPPLEQQQPPPLCSLPPCTEPPSPPLAMLTEQLYTAMQQIQAEPHIRARSPTGEFLYLPRTLPRRFLSSYPPDVAARMQDVVATIMTNRCARKLTPSGVKQVLADRSDEWRLGFVHDAATNHCVVQMDMFDWAQCCKAHGVVYKDLVTMPEVEGELVQRAKTRILEVMMTWKAQGNDAALNRRRLFYVLREFKDWVFLWKRQLCIADTWPCIHLVNVFHILTGEELFRNAAEMYAFVQVPAMFEHISPERVELEEWQD
jgi:hypothetical protein